LCCIELSFLDQEQLLILAYLIKKGGLLGGDVYGRYKLKGRQILLREKGHPQAIIDVLDQIAAQQKRVPIGVWVSTANFPCWPSISGSLRPVFERVYHRFTSNHCPSPSGRATSAARA